MTRAGTPAGTPVQPSLAELMGRYLQRQLGDQAAGLARADTGEVVPFEAAPVQPVDARLAWEEGQDALQLLHPEGGKLPKKRGASGLQAPPDWPALVASHEPEMAPAFSAGNFPQMARNFHSLLHAGGLESLRPRRGQAMPAPSLLDWATAAVRKNAYPHTLLALGALRLAGQLDSAVKLFQETEANVPAGWRAAWENERAALAWHRGEPQEAAALWRVQADSVPVFFNRGMAALFLGRPSEARPWLTQAVAQLPDDNAWHHLGRLYLTLAEISGSESK